MKGILLCGKAGSGKDSIGMELVEHYDFFRVGFADALKKHCSSRFNYPLDWNYNAADKARTLKIEEKIPPKTEHEVEKTKVLFHDTVRKLLIEVGVQYRYKDKNYWVDVAWKNMEILSPPFVVITDGRYENEADFMREKGFLIVRLYADRKSRIIRTESPAIVDSEHPSENDLNDYDFDLIVDNSDGTSVVENAKKIYEEFVVRCLVGKEDNNEMEGDGGVPS